MSKERLVAVCMKARAEHFMPLSDQAIASLNVPRAAYPEGGTCFPNTKRKPFSDMVFTKALRDMPR